MVAGPAVRSMCRGDLAAYPEMMNSVVVVVDSVVVVVGSSVVVVVEDDVVVSSGIEVVVVDVLVEVDVDVDVEVEVVVGGSTGAWFSHAHMFLVDNTVSWPRHITLKWTKNTCCHATALLVVTSLVSPGSTVTLAR